MAEDNNEETYALGDGTTISWQELRDRVKVVEPGIVKFLEPAAGSAAALAVIGELLQLEGKKFGNYVMVGDLTEANLPSAEYREVIVEWMKAQPCVHTCYVQPAGIVPRVALRFMMGRAGVAATVHKNMDEALTKARSFVE
jgi:hypothetical protein